MNILEAEILVIKMFCFVLEIGKLTELKGLPTETSEQLFVIDKALLSAPNKLNVLSFCTNINQIIFYSSRLPVHIGSSLLA